MKKSFHAINVKRLQFPNSLKLKLLYPCNFVLNSSFFSPEKHGGGFFSKAYITYLVTTQPTDYRVRRRYSDFEWLKTILSTIFPGVSVIISFEKSYKNILLYRFLLFRKKIMAIDSMKYSFLKE